MYSKFRTLSAILSLANTSIDIPRDAVIDQIMLKLDLTVANASGDTAYSGRNEAVLRAIQEIRVISNGSTVHYALGAVDAAILNAFNSKYGIAPDLKEMFGLAPGANQAFTFFLRLDEGDILAASKDSLEMKIVVNPTIATGVTITSLTGTVTIVENVLTTTEFVNTYGSSLEYAAEPKVYALSAPVTASSAMTNVLDLPTGSLMRAGVLQFLNGGMLGDVDPSKVGLINTSPDRREILNIDFATLRALNASEYDVNGIGDVSGTPLVEGVAMINYAKDVTSDGYGLRGWRFTKGDYQITAKTDNAATLRYISLEHVVNTTTFDSVETAVLEKTR